MPSVSINENEQIKADKKVFEFFEQAQDLEGAIRIASWNCASGFTTQFEHFKNFMEDRSNYIDILCLQGFPMTNRKKHADVFNLFDTHGFTHVYGEREDEFYGCNYLKTMTLFKKSFLEKYDVIPEYGHRQSIVENYHIKLKGIESDSLNDNFMLSNVYLCHGRDKHNILMDMDDYCYEKLGDPYKIVIGDFNYDVHRDFQIQALCSVRSMAPENDATANGYRADHVLSDIYVETMVDERFTRGTYDGYIKIPGTHFHQPIYGFFVPREKHTIYKCQEFYDTQKQLGCYKLDHKWEIPCL